MCNAIVKFTLLADFFFNLSTVATYHPFPQQIVCVYLLQK